MSDEQEKQESQKTVVAFIAGLLIGGLLVWVFGGTPEATPEAADETAPETSGVTSDESSGPASDVPAVTGDTSVAPAPAPVAELPTGNGAVSVADQSAGNTVTLGSATFPSDEGWIGVRDYVDGQMAGLLGVVRYSKEQGLVPEDIIVQRATEAGNTYAIVFYSESGDREFSLAEDTQIGGPVATFTAQ